MKNRLLSAAMIFCMMGCKSVSSEDVQNAKAYLSPASRYVQEPEYCFSVAEEERALQEAQKKGANTVFEVVIDNEGVVQRARLIKTHVREYYHEDMVQQVRGFKFAKDPKTVFYRAFYLPMKYSFNAQFEWVGR